MMPTDSQTLGLLSANMGFLTNMVRDLQTEVAGLRAELRDSSRSTSEASSPVKEKKEKKKKKEVPEGHIKKPPTAFLMWQNEYFRPTFKEENPDVPPKEVSSAAGAAWKAMSEEEKAPWTDKYNTAKAAWDLATGKPTGGKKVETVITDETSQTSILDQVLGNTSEKSAPEEELSKEDKKAAKKAAKKAEKLAAKKAEKLAAKKAEKLAAQKQSEKEEEKEEEVEENDTPLQHDKLVVESGSDTEEEEDEE